MKTRVLPCLTAFLIMTIPMSSGIVAAQETGLSLGEFTGSTNIGNPAIAGNATYNGAKHQYELSAGGANIWGKRDEFQFIWKKMSGNFILQARVEFIGKGTDPHRKIGWMIRTSLDEDAVYADAAVHGEGLTSLQCRRAKGGDTVESRLPIKGPDVIQLEKKGNKIIFSAAAFGEPFGTNQSIELPLEGELYVGLFACSHRSNILEQAVFRNVRIVRPAKDNFIPYNDYIGSHLEILDVKTGDREILLSSAQPFEAPNWTLDGSALIYNSSGANDQFRGRLYRFDLATKKPAIINTEFAIRNNNDHVLSFDGKMLGISHQGPEHNHQSAVYTVSSSGGSPKQITPSFPSYLHGWSPDAKLLVYTGVRNGKADVYRIPSTGGNEERLTDAKGISDGPEYTPDGKYIYFNSNRSGPMQIWRMKPDGKDQEQVTHDDFNNWFPHISPDGKWIVFLSYLSDVASADHPYYKHVYLRLMPIEGGTPRVIAYVYGGQGTINVPSWSPDGARVAFVSNSEME